MIPKLTKEEAIQEHRKMWNWIAEQYRKCEQGGCSHIRSIMQLKQEFVDKEFPGSHIINSCFCCLYASVDGSTKPDVVIRGTCDCCPINWESEADYFKCMDLTNSEDGEGYFKRALDAFDRLDVSEGGLDELIEISEKIANLPEEEDV